VTSSPARRRRLPVHPEQAVLAEFPEGEVGHRLVDEHPGGGARQQDLPAVRRRGDPRGSVQAHSDVLGLDHLRLAGVEAHPRAHLGAARPGVRRERPLGVCGRPDGLPGAREPEEHRVALGPHLLAAVRAGRVAQELPVHPEEAGVLAAEPLQQLGRAFDVREQERDRPARQLRHRPAIVSQGRLGRSRRFRA
jgi:hypothetical protein